MGARLVFEVVVGYSVGTRLGVGGTFLQNCLYLSREDWCAIKRILYTALDAAPRSCVSHVEHLYQNINGVHCPTCYIVKPSQLPCTLTLTSLLCATTVQSQLGKPRTRCFSLPPSNFTYGMKNVCVDGGAAEGE